MHRKEKSSSVLVTVYDFMARLVPTSLKYNFKQFFPLWVSSLLVGLVAVFYAKLFEMGEQFFTRLLAINVMAVFFAVPAAFILSWLLVKTLAPGARGSGIPQVMAAIQLATPRDNHRVNKLLSLRILLVKIVSSVVMVAGGGAIGREGPTIQIAGSVFRVVNGWIPATWPRLSRQSYILTGAAAGLAAAFNTPLGGIVFAVEELAKIHIRFFRTALFAAVIIAGLTSQFVLGPYLYLGYPEVKGLTGASYAGVVITSVVAALAGAFMCKLILWLMKWRSGFSVKEQVVFLLVAGLAVATTAYFVNAAILGSGKDVLAQVLFTGNKNVDAGTVAMRVAGPVISFNSGGAGGIFAPSLAAGAAVGSFLSGVLDVSAASNTNILILSGMVAFLTGVTRTPFTAAILVLEMTDRHSVIFHLMLSAMIAGMVSLLVDKQPFYERLKNMYVKEALEDEAINAQHLPSAGQSDNPSNGSGNKT